MHRREEIAALGSRYGEPATDGKGRQNESEGEAADDAAEAEIAGAHAATRDVRRAGRAEPGASAFGRAIPAGHTASSGQLAESHRMPFSKLRVWRSLPARRRPIDLPSLNSSVDRWLSDAFRPA